MKLQKFFIEKPIPESDFNSKESRIWRAYLFTRHLGLFQYNQGVLAKEHSSWIHNIKDDDISISTPVTVILLSDQEGWKDAIVNRNRDDLWVITFESSEGWSPDKEKKYIIHLKNEELDLRRIPFNNILIIEYLFGKWYIISGEMTNFPIGRSTNVVSYPVDDYILKMKENIENIKKEFKSGKHSKIEYYGMEPYFKDLQDQISRYSEFLLDNPTEVDRILKESSKKYVNKYKKYTNKNKDFNNENRNYEYLYKKYKKKYLNLKYSSNKDHMIHSKNYPSNS